MNLRLPIPTTWAGRKKALFAANRRLSLPPADCAGHQGRGRAGPGPLLRSLYAIELAELIVLAVAVLVLLARAARARRVPADARIRVVGCRGAVPGALGLAVLARCSDDPDRLSRFLVVAQGPATLRPLELTGLLESLEVFPSVEAALATV